MQGRNEVQAKKGNGNKNIEPGTYTATLRQITAWTNDVYQKAGQYEPQLTFTWYLGKDDSDTDVYMIDMFVRMPRDSDGYPVLNEESALYKRMSALFGERFSTKDSTWDIGLPEAYDSVKGLLELPHYRERSEEGFTPVKLRYLKVNGIDLIGKQAQIEIAKKGEYPRVVNATAVPKQRKLRQVEVEAEEALPV